MPTPLKGGGGFVAGNQLSWNLMGNDGFTLANDVYLYVITARGVSGDGLRSEVRKLVVLR